MPIGAWVRRRACEQDRAWQAALDAAAGGEGDGVRARSRVRLTMAVNVSAPQLQHPNLVGLVADALSASGLDPSALVLEITESATVADTEATITRLRHLKDLGVGLAIDDFGTGYSSLSYLRRFPVDLLKIDRSFVAGMLHSPEDAAIVSHVIGLAHAFGLKVVAEGVETVHQLEELTRLGCDLAQGYNWRRPEPAGGVENWLATAFGDGDGPFGAVGAARPQTLLVDDRGSVRAAVRLAMELHGGFLVVAEAADGRSAVELARRHQPDLVMLDLVMPGQGGLEALPAIRAAAPGAAIVLLTASDDDVPSSAVDQTRGLFDKTSDLSSLVDRVAEATRSSSAA